MTRLERSTAGIGRRDLITALGAAGAAAAMSPLPAFAQGATRRPIIAGIIQQPKATNINYVNFQAAMAALGWIDGQNVTYEWRFADGDATKIPALVQELLRLNPTVIYGGNVNGSLAAKQATSTIPIVANGTGTDDQAHELYGPDFAHPAYNVIGTLAAPAPSPIAVTQRTALMKELLPNATKFGYCNNTAVANGGEPGKADALASALVCRVAPVMVEFRSTTDLPAVFQTLARERVDALIAPPLQWQQYLPMVTAAKLPTTATEREAVAQGALMGVYTVASVDAADRSQRLGAAYMDKLLKGAKVADLKPERLPADEYRVAVNMATARMLGIVIPKAMLDRVDKVG